jgi:hypothetical protein
MLLAMLQVSNPIGFLISFLIFICVVAVVILGIRWLIRISGVTISPELNLIIGIILFLILLVLFLNYVPGLHVWH